VINFSVTGASQIQVRGFATALVLALSLGIGATGWAQIPPELEAAVHAKVLSFDRGLGESTGPLRLAVAFDPASPASVESGKAIASGFRALAQKRVTIHGRKLVVIEQPVGADVTKVVGELDAEALYLSDGLERSVALLARSAAARKIRTLCGRRDYLASGVAVAVEEKSRRPAIVLHIGNAKRIGMALDPRLVRLAEVVK